MNKYAVAVLSFFENDNKVFIVESESSTEAMCQALVMFQGEEIDNDTKEWINTMRDKTIDEIQDICSNGELAISEPVLIK